MNEVRIILVLSGGLLVGMVVIILLLEWVSQYRETVRRMNQFLEDIGVTKDEGDKDA